MSISICVIYHSGYGHTQKQAEPVAAGVSSVEGIDCHSIGVEALHDPEASESSSHDDPAAINMGRQTYMDSASADFKKLM